MSGVRFALNAEEAEILAALASWALKRHTNVPRSTTVTGLRLTAEIGEWTKAQKPQGCGNPEVPQRSEMIEWVTCAEAAKFLDISTRQVRNIAFRLGGEKLRNGRYRFNKASVLAEAARREKAKEEV